MTDDLRKSGIGPVGDIPWSTHFCQFYKTRKDMVDTLVPYFKAGLENNEFCMWVTAEPLTAEDARRAMTKAVPHFSSYVKKGQIEIVPYTEWYIKGGSFDAGRVLKGWVEKLELGLSRGYDGLRLSGNTFWLEKKGWKDFADYEAAVNSVIGKYRMIALCTYSLDKCNGSEVLDVVRNHQFALIKRQGKWELIESALYKQTGQVLRTALEESQRRGNEIEALLDGARAVLKQGEFKDVARALWEHCKDMTGATGGYVAMLSKSGAENEVLFLDSGGLPCTVDPSQPMPVRGLREEAYRTGKAAYCNSFAQSEHARYLPDGHVGIDSVLFAPLVIEGKAVGLLGLANKPGGFTDADAHLVSGFGELASVALRNSRTWESLEHSEERFRSITQTAGDAIVTADSQGNIVLWNRAAQAVFGYSADEVVGSQIAFIMPERFREAHLKAMGLAVSAGHASIRGKTVEVAGLRKDGTEFPLELSLATWKAKDGIFFTAIMKDVSARNQAEEALRETSEYLNNLFDYANAPIIVWAHQFKITRFNHAFERLTGRSAAEVLGKSLDILFPAGSKKESMDHIRKTVAGERWETVEIPILHKDGDVRTVLWNSATLFDADRKPVATIAQGQDITGRKKAEEEVKGLNESLKRRNAELEAANKELEAFSYSVSHDLRAPLRNIAGFSEAVLEDYHEKLDDQGKFYLRRIDAGCQLMGELIDDILKLSRVTRAEMRWEKVNLTEIAESVARRLGDSEPEREVDFVIAPGMIVRGDSQLVPLVVDNLMSNAWKFSNKRRPARIEFGVIRKDGQQTYFVRDNGAGFDMTYAGKLFSPFQRLHQSEEFSGTGIGLAIVQRVVNRHGGRVWAEGAVGEGATFYFTLGS